MNASQRIGAALRAGVLWFMVEGRVVEKRRCREYTVFDADGASLLAGRAFLMRRDFPLSPLDAPDEPCLLLRRRRSFPVSGKYDLFAMPDAARIGLLSRSGRFRDAQGRAAGRFRDARTMKDRWGESAFEVAGQLIFGGEGDTAGSSPQGFVLLLEGKAAGSLTQKRLPFDPVPVQVREPHIVARTLRRVLPKKTGDALFERRPPRGWALELDPRDHGIEPRLLLGAALLAIEISRW